MADACIIVGDNSVDVRYEPAFYINSVMKNWELFAKYFLRF